MLCYHHSAFDFSNQYYSSFSFCRPLASAHPARVTTVDMDAEVPLSLIGVEAAVRIHDIYV